MNREENLHYESVIFDEMVTPEQTEETYFATISALIDERYLQDADDLESFKKTIAYEAIQNALNKYEANPCKDIWIGECSEDLHLVAVLERDFDQELEDDELAFTATVYGEL